MLVDSVREGIMGVDTYDNLIGVVKSCALHAGGFDIEDEERVVGLFSAFDHVALGI